MRAAPVDRQTTKIPPGQRFPRDRSLDYEQTCLPPTLRHTGRRGGGGFAAPVTGRGGGALTAGCGGRGGGDTFIACGGGFATVDGGGVRSLGDPVDGDVLVTLAPAPGATLVALPPVGGVPF